MYSMHAINTPTHFVAVYIPLVRSLRMKHNSLCVCELRVRAKLIVRKSSRSVSRLFRCNFKPLSPFKRFWCGQTTNIPQTGTRYIFESAFAVAGGSWKFGMPFRTLFTVLWDEVVQLTHLFYYANIHDAFIFEQKGLGFWQSNYDLESWQKKLIWINNLCLSCFKF